MSTYLSGYGSHITRQTVKAKPNQVVNNAGGYVWKINCFERLKRFLVLGSEGGTYYASEHDLTKQNVTCIEECLKEDYKKTIDIIVDYSVNGKAGNNDTCLFALAIASAYDENRVRRYALGKLPKVARIGTHLMHFAAYANSFRGWGRGLRTAIANWYLKREPSMMAFQVAKYQSRDGWSNADLFRKTHPVFKKDDGSEDLEKHIIASWVVDGWGTDWRWNPEDSIFWGTIGNLKKGENGKDDSSVREVVDIYAPSLKIIWAMEKAKTTTDRDTRVSLIKEYNLTHEMIPTEWKADRDIWKALLVKMPMEAMIRNLPTMTRVGLLEDREVVQEIVTRLGNKELLKKARIHPIKMLFAAATYSHGEGFRGHSQWTPNPRVSGAMEKAFTLCFDNVTPTGKRIMLALDVSGSMSGGGVGGSNISPREASAAMALVTRGVEENVFVGAFCDTFIKIELPGTIDRAIQYTGNMPFGSTDCAQPMLYAIKHNLNIDTFIVYTDNETWSGSVHPYQALKQYRDKSGIDAQLIVVGMTATEFSIADPNDKGMLDVVGMSPDVPEIMSIFMRKEI